MLLSICFISLIILEVLILQQLFGTNRLRVLDSVTIQCRFHSPSSLGHWRLRPVCVRADSGSISTTLHAWPKERVLYQDRVLALGGQCSVPQHCKSLSLLQYLGTDYIGKILFGFSVILFWGDLKQASGYDSGHWFWGTTLYLAVLLTVLGKAALISE